MNSPNWLPFFVEIHLPGATESSIFAASTPARSVKNALLGFMYTTLSTVSISMVELPWLIIDWELVPSTVPESSNLPFWEPTVRSPTMVAEVAFSMAADALGKISLASGTTISAWTGAASAPAVDAPEGCSAAAEHPVRASRTPAVADSSMAPFLKVFIRLSPLCIGMWKSLADVKER